MYADSRAPAANTRRTWPGVAPEREETNITAPTYAEPKIAHASVCHSAVLQRAPGTGPYQGSQASGRWLTRRSAIRVTRTSLPGGAVVAVSNRCRASRLAEATRSSVARSTPGRHVEASAVGSAKIASRPSRGRIDIKRPRGAPNR